MRLVFFVISLLILMGSAELAFSCPAGTHQCGPVCCKG